MESIILGIGEQKQLTSHSSEKISLSHGGIVQIKEQESSITIIGVKKGKVTLEQEGQTYIIQVLPLYEKQNWVSMIKLLSRFPLVQWGLGVDQINIYGSIYRFYTWKKIAALSRRRGIPYTLWAHVHPKARSQARHFFKNQSPQPFKIRWLSPIIFKTRKPKLFQKLSHFGMQIQEDLTIQAPLIEWNILLAEFQNQKSSVFSQNNQLMEGVISNHSNLAPSQILNSFSESNNQNQGQLITSKKVLAELGSKSSFFIGGEVPIHEHHIESNTSKTKFKPYGISLSLQAELQGQGLLKLDMSSRISEINPAYSTDQSIATKNHNLTSSFSIRNNQTLLLTHFERRQSGQSGSSNFLSSLPVIGDLLFQKNKNEGESHAYLFITPKIIYPSFDK